MRLDKYLTENNFYASRTRAERAIEEGLVMVNGITITKPSLDISGQDIIKSLPDPVKYVSRGALKLEAAFERYTLNVAGKICVDIGASTGGFTEVLLEHSAGKIYAVDVGKSQLHEKLVQNQNVVNLEKTDIRSLGNDFTNFFDVAVCDCSFISLKKVLPKAFEIMKNGADGIFLIKPQFETENNRKLLGKTGVVKNEKERLKIRDGIVDFANELGFQIKNVSESPIKGGDGNVEYLLYLVKN